MKLIATVLLFFTVALASDEAALLKAIVDHPGEDTPRLMYADWLEEHGQAERARFIRIQIERAGLSRHSPRYTELESQEAAILKDFEKKWLPPPLAKVRPGDFRTTWERGWVNEVAVSPDALQAKEVRDAIDSLDLVRGVFIRVYSGSANAPIAHLLSMKSAARLTSVGFNHLNVSEMETLGQAAFPHIRRLQVLSTGEGAYFALAQSKLARQLVDLRIALSGGQLANLANHEAFQKLESLAIEGWANPHELRNRSSLPHLRALELTLYDLYEEDQRAANAHAADLGLFLPTAEFRALRRFVLQAKSHDSGSTLPGEEPPLLLPSAERLIGRLAASQHNLTEFLVFKDGEPVQLPNPLLNQLEANQRRLQCQRVIELLSATKPEP